jgi:DNA-binding transcriptional MerR regulator
MFIENRKMNMLTKTEKLGKCAETTNNKTMDNENYISPNKITKQYDITSGTLRRWAENGKIRCLRPNGGKRIYNIEDINKMFSISMNEIGDKTEELVNEKNIDGSLSVVIQNLESVNEELKSLLPERQNINVKQLETVSSTIESIKQTIFMFT